MRVSLPICIGSCLLVLVLTWWLSTRSRDFLTEPSGAELERIRLTAAQTNPTAQGLGDALSPVSDTDASPIPVVLPKHVSQAPRLDDYADEAKYGADYLIGLAKLLSNEHPERALTCWERVLDSCKPSDSQRQQAARSIARLKKSSPAWITEPEKGLPIVIQAGTGPTAAALLAPLLDELASHLQECSSGVLRVTAKVSTGSEDMIDQGKAPVALWVSGPEAESASTDVVSFFTPIENPDGLADQTRREIYRIVRHHLAKHGTGSPPTKISPRDPPARMLSGQVTRLSWQNFAESLQKTP